MIIVGGDLGNQIIKVVYNSKTKFKLNNSVKKVPSLSKRNDLGEAQEIMDNLDVTITSKHINGRFYVGPLASKLGEVEVEPGKRKLHNEFLPVPFLTLLALNALGKKEEVKACVGLPIKEFTDDRAAFEEKLRGIYKVKFNTHPFKEVEIDLKDVAVIAEGVAVLFNLALDDAAKKYRDPGLMTRSIAFVDIGAFTTDIAVFLKGKADSDVSDGLPEGISLYVDMIVEHLKGKFDIMITRSQLVEMLQVQNYKLQVRKEVIDIKPLFDEVFDIFARNILEKINNIWKRNYSIDAFFIVGGGAMALRPYLEKLSETFSEREIPLEFLPDEEDPQLQNAEGYWKYAMKKFGSVKTV